MTSNYDDSASDEDTYPPDELTPLECPYCGLIMSYREAVEQGCCNDCYAFHGYTPARLSDMDRDAY